jgi:raffinose/stachyose/melibiose transport system permease protein
VPMIQFFIFYVIVNFNTFRLAFQKYEIVNGRLVSHFVWFDNISQVVQEFFTLPVLQAAFRNSLYAYLIGLVFGMSLSLFFSYYIFKKFPLANMFKVFLYLPNIVSVMALAIMYKYIFDYAMPLVLNRENPDLKMVRLLTDQNTRFAMIMLFNTFVTLGSNVLLYTGTMSGISPSILEAAQVDGVNRMQELFLIVLPQVYPTIVTFLIAQMATIFSFHHD